MGSYQEHAERLSHDAVEEVEGRVSSHHEEVRQEEELPAAVVQQSVVLAPKQRLIGVLQKHTDTCVLYYAGFFVPRRFCLTKICNFLAKNTMHCAVCMRASSHPAVSSLGGVWYEDGSLQFSGAQYCPPLAKGEDGVPALQRRLGEKTCTAMKEPNNSDRHAIFSQFQAQIFIDSF